MNGQIEKKALESYNDDFHNPAKMDVRSTVPPEECKIDFKEPFKAFYLDVYQKAYKQAVKDVYPLVRKLCEAVLFEWDDVVDVARETTIEIEKMRNEYENGEE